MDASEPEPPHVEEPLVRLNRCGSRNGDCAVFDAAAGLCWRRSGGAGRDHLDMS